MRDEYRKSVKVTMATGKNNKSFDNVNDHRKTRLINRCFWRPSLKPMYNMDTG